MGKTSFKQGLGLLALVVFLAGFFMTDRASFTGNTVLDGQQSFNPLVLLGLLLVFISAVLVFYIIRKKD